MTSDERLQMTVVNGVNALASMMDLDEDDVAAPDCGAVHNWIFLFSG